MEKQSDLSLISLPKRRKGAYLNKARKTNLVTNLYKVEFDTSSIISIFAVRTEPDLAHDSTHRLNSIIQSAKKSLEPHVGSKEALIFRQLCPLWSDIVLMLFKRIFRAKKISD